MTISSTTVKNSYSGNGTLDTFNYTFKVFADADIQVIIRDATATETVKTLTTHYTVTGAGSASGGTIVFTAGNIPSATETVVIRRASPQTQAIDYIANDPFPAESHEEGLDRSMMAIQQLQEEIDRSIKLSRTNTMTSTEFAVGSTDRAGKIFGFDDNGELVVSQELGTFKGDWSASTTYAARDIVKDTSTNNIFLCNTGHTSSGVEPLTTNTDSAKWDLLVDAASATTSQNAAAASAAAALVSENNASTSESNALSYKNDAETAKTAAELAETNAETAQTAAEVAQAAAEAALDTFDDSFLGAKTSDPTVDNDGNALIDGALYFNTTVDLMKVYNLANTTWYQLALTGSNQTNVNTVAADLSGSDTIGTVATNIANVNTTATNIANINTTAGIDTEITNVSGISSAISAVNSNSSNINAVNANSTNINLLAANNTNITNVGGSINNVNTVATNLSDVNSFAETYRISSSAPTTSLDIGDLYFDTTADELKVYKSSGWSAAGSSVNGTSARYTYTISGTPSSVSGADDNSATLAYDAGFADVFVNGVRMSSADITITSGTSVVFASPLTDGDVVDIVAYGTFNVAAIDASNITSGTLNTSRIADASITNAKLATPFSLTLPTISSISPDTIDNAEATITITGSNFTSVPQVEFLNPSTGIWYTASTVTFNNSTSLTVTVTLTVDAQYKIRVENPDGLAILSGTILTVSDAPTWNTAAGDLGTFAGDFSGTLATLSATSDSAITYSEVGSNLTTANVTLNTSTGALTTTDFGGTSTTATTYNFTIRATDAENQTADRSFSLTSSFGATGGGQFN
ncbi:tail fiber [Pelagibacter phage Greip EXVC021P]|nr:tail fiber [Pelagibacter phage Greip EXVC021P]